MISFRLSWSKKFLIYRISLLETSNRVAWKFTGVKFSELAIFCVLRESFEVRLVLETNVCDFLFKQQNVTKEGKLIFSSFITCWVTVRSIYRHFTEFYYWNIRRCFITALKGYRNNNIKQEAYLPLAMLNKTLLVMRQHISGWLVGFYQYMQNNPAIIENGWKRCGIADALSNGVLRANLTVECFTHGRYPNKGF